MQHIEGEGKTAKTLLSGVFGVKFMVASLWPVPKTEAWGGRGRGGG